MNEEYRFLETIANFLEQGYLIQDVLNICKYIYNNDRIEQLKLKLNEGKSLDEAILECDFMKLKKELTYPSLLIVFLMMFSLFIVYALLPSIMQLFNEFSIEPSLITRFMFMLFKIIPILILGLLISFIGLCFVAIYAINKQYFQLIDFFVSHIFMSY